MNLTQIMGLGTPGELRHGPDGRVYGWVEGLDSYGRRKGGWTPYNRLRRRAYRFCAYTFPNHFDRRTRIRPAQPYTKIRPVYSQIIKPSTSSMPRVVRPLAVSLRGLGASPDIQGLFGVGYPGAIVHGPDGHLYGWVSGYDGLGSPLGFWGRLKRLIRSGLKFVTKKLAPNLLPIANKLLTFVPGIGPAAATALNVARGAGLLGIAETGAPIYLGRDGLLYGIGENAITGLGEPFQEVGEQHLYGCQRIHGVGEQHLYGDNSHIQGLEVPIQEVGEQHLYGDGSHIQGLEGLIQEVGEQHLYGDDSHIQGLDDPIQEVGEQHLYGDDSHIQGLNDPIQEVGEQHLYGDDSHIQGLDNPIQVLGEQHLYGDNSYIQGLEDPIQEVGEQHLYGEGSHIQGLEDPIQEVGEQHLYGDPNIQGADGYIMNNNSLLGYQETRPSTTPVFKSPTNTPDIWKPYW